MVGVTVLDVGPWGGKGLPGQDELPSDDGEPMETSFHHAQGHVLIESLATAWNDRRDFYVAGNMFVYFSERQVKRNDFRGPDVFVVLGTERTPRKSWVAWEEGGKLPDVVIEVTSETTEKIDREDKMQIYATVWRTPAYFIFDPETDKLDGYRLDVDRLAYAPIPRDARGDFDVAPMQLKLGLRQAQYRDWDRLFVRWIDANGKPLPLPYELMLTARQAEQRALARAEAERERAEAERERAEQAQQRVRELEDQLAKSKK
ncbi:MAG TPA: Uma2 family endonuclease [Polyangiaceae bacterium]|nr:Uma2 family endonuclease [Polyangiaceae bacterium]